MMEPLVHLSVVAFSRDQAMRCKEHNIALPRWTRNEYWPCPYWRWWCVKCRVEHGV